MNILNRLPSLELLDFDDAGRMWHKEMITSPLRDGRRNYHSYTRTNDSKHMTTKGKSRIFNKFIFFVLPFVVLSITITSVVLTWINFNHFRKTITIDYQNIIRSSAGEISIFMAHGMEDLKALARVLAAVKPDPWQQEIALSAFQYQYKHYLFLSLISDSGQTLASTQWEDDDIGTIRKALIESAMTGKSSVSTVQLTKEQMPHVLIAVPVTALGKVNAVLWAALDLKYIWDILEDITIGETGQVCIMDLSGRYLAHREIDKVLIQPPIQAPDILKKIARSDKPVSWFEKSDGTAYYCLGTHIPALDWVVVLRQPTREIYYYLYRNIFWAALITLAACLCTFILGWYRTKIFLKPIHTLHHQVRQIKSGDLDRNVTVSTTDEIGELAMAFNEMTASLKKMIAKEIQSAQELAHAQDLAVLGASASKCTHEVGNLLNNIAMATNALSNETLSARGTGILATMEKESARVKTFIQDFLKFAKPPELRLTPLSLDLTIREVMAVHAQEAKARGITFDLDWPYEVPKVPADAQLIYQVFNNLIKNSTEAVQDKGRIRISAALDKDYLAVTIKDNGSGIAAEHLERIFEPFFTTKSDKGTGLGMAIVKSTITAHRGTITCQSTPENGTRFVIRLPLK